MAKAPKNSFHLLLVSLHVPTGEGRDAVRQHLAII